MKSLTDLPIDLLNIIFTILAASTTGFRDLALISATCKQFKHLSEQPRILRKINFCIVCIGGDDTKKHHSLLAVGDQDENQATMSWVKVLENLNVPLREILHSHTLVRSFIRHAWYIDIAKVQNELLEYATLFIGHDDDVGYASAILGYIDSICIQLMLETYVHRHPCYHSDDVVVSHYNRLRVIINRLLDARKELIAIFDQLPPKRFIKFGTFICEI